MTSDWTRRDADTPRDKAAQDAAETNPAASRPYVSPEVLREAAEDAAPDPQAALAEELAGARDKLLRTLAEMENLRRRTEREVSDARTYGISGFARDILDIADNLHRALGAIPADARESGDASLKAFVEGVELTERALMQTLEKNGVKKFDPTGQKFDPNKEQAMYEVPDPSVPAGTVVQVVQAGYMIGERVLRPALVGVAKGGPKDVRSESGAPSGSANGA